jgi:hypothetical protein
MTTLRTCVLATLTLTIVWTSCGASAAQTWFDSNVRPRTSGGNSIPSERDEQRSLYNHHFEGRGLEYEVTLEKLKNEASVAAWRIPYSASIHPESGGGLSSARIVRRGWRGLFGRRGGASVTRGASSPLKTYDRAFHDGDDLSDAYEIRRVRGGAEHWEGYCSGFTASTIRHPEPMRSVDAGQVGGTPGVVFQPSEIKALLSGIYNRTTKSSYLYLAPPTARGGGPNMGTFHLTLGNYIGQAGHPVGIDRTRGQIAWNNPIYAYRVISIRDAGASGAVRFKSVTTTIYYTYYGSDSERQTDPETGARTGNRRRSMTLRYLLALDSEGKIIGGRAQSSSGHFLWIPLYAVQARKDGSTPGNPYLDVRKVLALARASALSEVQAKYDEAIIGPAMDPALAEVEPQQGGGEQQGDSEAAPPETP